MFVEVSVFLLTAWSGGCDRGRAIQPNPVPTLSSISPTTATAGGPAVTLTDAANNPAPTIGSLVPNSETAGAPTFALIVNGTNFIGSSAIKWNGSARTTTFVSATQITATISATDIMAAGTAQVTVMNPAPGGGTSPATAFDIIAAANPFPTVSNISPTNPTAGAMSEELSTGRICFEVERLTPKQTVARLRDLGTMASTTPPYKYE